MKNHLSAILFILSVLLSVTLLLTRRQTAAIIGAALLASTVILYAGNSFILSLSGTLAIVISAMMIAFFFFLFAYPKYKYRSGKRDAGLFYFSVFACMLCILLLVNLIGNNLFNYLM